MTSVSNQQYAPYHAHYEMPSKPVPDQDKGPTEAQGDSPSPQSNSGSSRQPMSAQQRGQFSTHRGLVNTPSSQGGADAAQLAKLSQENKQLKGKLDQLVAQLQPVIQQLQQQVAALLKQLDTPGNSETETPPSNQGSKADPEAAHNHTSPEETAPAESTKASQQGEPHNLQQLTAENKKLHKMVEGLQTEFTAIVTGLRKQIQELSQKLGGAGTPETQSTADTRGPDANRETAENTGSVEETSDAENSTSSAQSNETSSPPNSSIDDLMRQNEQLRTRIDQMIAEFTSVISELKQQIEQLSAQVKARAA